MGISLLKAVLTCAAILTWGVNAAFAADLDEGVAAYRSGDYGAAWALLHPAAAKEDPAAQRYLGLMILNRVGEEARRAGLEAGVALLTDAARAGDYAALIALEELRLKGLKHSPTVQDMVSIEITRAENGDPVSAWRLVKRYETGDGVEASSKGAARWLAVVAAADQRDFPKSDEAAFKLCEYHASGAAGAVSLDEARHWCKEAVRKGHPGATLALKRLARADH